MDNFNSVSACTVSGDYIIYKTICIINKKYYVGQKYLLSQDVNYYLGSGIKLGRAIKKYGRENFIRETIEYCTSATVNIKEIFWIAELSATNPLIGYNIAIGGYGGKSFKGHKHTEESKIKISEVLKGRKLSEETKSKMSISKIGNKNSFGRKLSEEHKIKIGNTGKGRIVTQETRTKISEANKGRKISEETKIKMRKSHLGIPLSEETKRRMSEAHIRKTR